MPRKRNPQPADSAIPAAEKAEKAAELCVLADPKDLQALAALHTLLEEIAAACQASHAAAHESARRMAAFLERVILGDAGEPAAGLSLIGKGIAALQRLLCQGRSLNEADMPAEFVAVASTTPAGAKNAVDSSMAVPSAVDSSPKDVPHPPTAPLPVSSGLPDLSLLAEFIAEAREHFAMGEEKLLALESEPRAEEALNSLFRVFHTIKGVAGFLNLNDIGTVAHEAENLLDKARRKELLLQGAAIEAAFAALDTLKRLTAAWEKTLATKVPPAADPAVPALLEHLRAAACQTAVPAMASVSPSSEPLAEAAEAPAGAPAAAMIKETVKVDAERLDRILDAIGELVIAESMVSQSSEIRGLRSAQIDRQLSQLDKITRELQEMGMSLRMVPIKATFQKMARLVRDLAKKSGKAVDFVMSGEDTEIDKSVVDRIGDPLVHMVRNAVDHGLEASAEERRRLGKPEAGRVMLRAFHKSGNIWIEIEDDGRGLDRDAILAKARRQGLLRPDETPPESEIYNLIFLPGFSTAQKVTEVSGRGVGMDVVKRAVTALRGHVEIRTEKGKGATFSIRLPLTLAIIDGMVLRVAGERYILPTLSMIRAVRPAAGDVQSILGRGEVLLAGGETIPLFRLAAIFGLENANQDATKSIALVVESDGRKAALLVDELLGQQQIVIKSLGEGLRAVPGVCGGAIMPDGSVGLILDVAGLLAAADSGVSEAAANRAQSNGGDALDAPADESVLAASA